MINNFLPLYIPINTTIDISKNKAFRDKSLKITKEELAYLKTTLSILRVFVKATTKLQGDTYPTIYYTIPFIYSIYSQLEKLKEELVVSFTLNSYYNILTFIQKEEIFKNAINKAIAKLRKYYPTNTYIGSNRKALYYSLILDPRLKTKGLEGLLTSGQISDILSHLKEDYKK